MRDARADHRCQSDKITSHDLGAISAPFRRARVHLKHQGVSDPVTGRDRRSKNNTGVAHAMVSVNRHPQRALTGGTERRPFLVEACMRKSLHAKRLVALNATMRVAVGRDMGKIDQG